MKNTINKKVNFILMVIGQASSVFGTALLRFVLSLYILDVTGRADLYATLFAISSLPMLLSPLGGAVADRFYKKHVMVALDCINAVITVSLCLMIVMDQASIAFIAVVMTLLGFVGAMDTPVVTAIIPSLVEEDKLESANGIIQGVQALSAVVAPVLGGILYGVLGLELTVIIVAVAFMVTALLEMIIYVPKEFIKIEGKIVPTILNDLKDGVHFIQSISFIKKAMILSALLNLLLTPLFIVGVPVIFRVIMNSGDALYGIGMSFVEGATILGAIMTGLVAKKMKVKTLYQWFLIIAVLFIPMSASILPITLDFGKLPAFVIFLICAIPIAMIMTIISIFVITKVQKKTPNHLLGKVMAIIMAVSQCAAPIGQILYGIGFEIFLSNAYILILFACFMMVLLALLAKKMMKNESFE